MRFIENSHAYKNYELGGSGIYIDGQEKGVVIARRNEWFEILGPAQEHPFCDQNEKLFLDYNREFTKREGVRLVIYLREKTKALLEKVMIEAVEVWEKNWRGVTGIVHNPFELRGLICAPSKDPDLWAVIRPFNGEYAIKHQGDLSKRHLLTNPNISYLDQLDPDTKKSIYELPRNFEEKAFQTGRIFERNEIRKNFHAIVKIKRNDNDTWQSERIPEDEGNRQLFCFVGLPHSKNFSLHEWHPEHHWVSDNQLTIDILRMHDFFELQEIEIDEKGQVLVSGQLINEDMMGYYDSHLFVRKI